MAAIKTISRSAIAAFSPGENLIAAGTVAGILDSSLSSSTSLELFKLDFASDEEELALVGSSATTEPLSRLTWAGETGLLAGGLSDGTINVWNPATLIREFQGDGESVVEKIDKHTHKIVGLEFNPITPHFLASGDAEGTVYIWDITDVKTPKPCPPLQWKGASSISHLAWNRKVSHIFATTSYEGVCVVWDLKKRKSVLSFADPQSKMRYSSLQWNPEVPTELIVAIDDEQAPHLQAWDLRKANHPTRVLTGHSKGIFALAWCPSDSSMLLSSAKDNRTLCWDVVSGEVIGELPRESSWKFDVQWSPRTPGILSASSYDGKVGIYSIESCHQSKNEFGRAAGESHVLKAPKWLRRPVGASFGFGGKLVSFKRKAENSTASEVSVHTLSVEEGTVKLSTEIEEAAAHGDRRTLLKSFSDRKASEASSDKEREVWEFLRLMLDDDGGRKALLNQLGFHFSEVDVLAEEFEEKSQVEPKTPTPETPVDDGEDFFEKLEEPKEPEVPALEMNGNEESAAKEEAAAEGSTEQADDTSNDSDNAIEEALVVGNFKGAVAQCIAMNRMADALSIAYAGSQALGEKTRDEYVKKNQRSYFKVLSAIVTRDFDGLVENRPLSAWKQTLALLATYARGEDWSQLANALAYRLEYGGDMQAATICYICAANIEKTIEALSRMSTGPSYGTHAATNLQDIVEKSLVLAVAVELKRIGPALARTVESFCELLAGEGLLESAAAYLALVPGELPQGLKILRDRIQRSSQTYEPPVSVANRQSAAPLFSGSGYTPQVPSTQSFNYRAQTSTPTPSTYASQAPHGYTPSSPSMMSRPQPEAPPPFSTPSFPRPTHQPDIYSFSRPPPQQQEPFMRPPPQQQESNFNAPPSFMVPRPPQQSEMFPPAPGMMLPRQTQQSVPPSSPFNPVRVQPPTPQRVASPPQPTPMMPRLQQVGAPPGGFVSSAASQPAPTYTAPAPPAPPPTVHTVETQNVKDELKPVIATLKRLFAETSDISNPVKKREVEDTSRKLGALFAKLNAGDVSPNVETKLILLSQALDSRNFPSALEILGDLTSREWDECGPWLSGVRRITKSHQQSMR